MALLAEVTDAGNVANYHEITSVSALYSPAAIVKGSVGIISVVVNSYASAESRNAGSHPLFNKSYGFYFGSSSEVSAKNPVIVIKSDEPTRPDLYEALKKLPAYSSATDI